jgi:transposase InsO family protein
MTQALYIETANAERSMKEGGMRRLNVSGVLRILGASRSGYRAFKKRVPSARETRKAAIMVEIMEIYDESHQNYGAPKITEVLRAGGWRISEKTVGNYMRQMGIRAQYVKPYTRTTVDCDYSAGLGNIIDRDFNPEAPNAVWCTDITYIWTFAGFVYLTVIIDLFSRRVVSWVLAETLEARWTVEAVESAKWKRGVDGPLVIHSDRGVQYTCHAYRDATASFAASYSDKANPWDNAPMESFIALIKREWLDRFKIFDYRHAHKLVFEYIETFYNTVRVHSHCGYKSPAAYEDMFWEDANEAREAA